MSSLDKETDQANQYKRFARAVYALSQGAMLGLSLVSGIYLLQHSGPITVEMELKDVLGGILVAASLLFIGTFVLRFAAERNVLNQRHTQPDTEQGQTETPIQYDYEEEAPVKTDTPPFVREPEPLPAAASIPAPEPAPVVEHTISADPPPLDPDDLYIAQFLASRGMASAASQTETRSDAGGPTPAQLQEIEEKVGKVTGFGFALFERREPRPRASKPENPQRLHIPWRVDKKNPGTNSDDDAPPGRVSLGRGDQ